MDPKSTFVKRFGDLVALCRADPGNDAAQELALSAAAAAVASSSLVIHAVPEDSSLTARMLARQVESFAIAAGAPPEELQSLARALAHDVTPIPSTPHVTVELMRLLAPPPGASGGAGGPDGGPRENRRRSVDRRRGEDRRRSFRARRSGGERRRRDRRESGERRLYLIRDQQVQADRLLEALDEACRAGAWDTVLHGLADLVRLAPRVPRDDRRMLEDRVRRATPRPVLAALVGVAERDYVSREITAEVLGWIGMEAVEVVVDRLREGEALGVRAFFYDVVSRVPGAVPLVLPMLRSPHPHEVRHGAALLARLGVPEAVGALRSLLDHPDELVRSAAVQALGELHGAPAAEALGQALRHRSPQTRISAAEAIALWRGGVLAMLLAGALEEERDREAWQAMLSALGRIGSVEACAALAAVALTKRSMLRRRGFTTGQRLAAVTALGLAGSAAGRGALERLVQASDGVVSYAADRLLQAERLRVS